METNLAENSQKPSSLVHRPELTRLPELSWKRRVFRMILLFIIRVLSRIIFSLKVEGKENLPRNGPYLIVSNHLGDMDLIIGMTVAHSPIDILGKIELYDHPIVGKLMEKYGTIWIHRGQPDRRAIRAAVLGLKEGRMIAIAPEGRESLSGSLEEGTGGAAYIALKADVPLLPVTVTGTSNNDIYSTLRKLRRPKISLTIGNPFILERYPNLKASIKNGTQVIMRTLAGQLPPEYQGVYSNRESTDQ